MAECSVCVCVCCFKRAHMRLNLFAIMCDQWVWLASWPRSKFSSDRASKSPKCCFFGSVYAIFFIFSEI